MGLMDYRQCWDLQLRLAASVHDGEQPDSLLLVEHPAVYTRGRLSRPEHILLTDTELAELDIPVYEVDRGGQVTFHGPGQLVAYPIVDLRGGKGPVR